MKLFLIKFTYTFLSCAVIIFLASCSILDYEEDQNKSKYSLGGTNNLNVSWNTQQWYEYFETHKGNYQELNLNLDL